MCAFFKSSATLVTVFALLLCFERSTLAQDDEAFGDSAADPVKLFERGQNAHRRGDLDKALELYEQAIKVRPDFPEAEFQRATALTSKGRLTEAETGFRRAIELRRDWSLSYSALGSLLVRLNREREAEPLLRKALQFDSSDNLALRLLGNICLHSGAAKEALELGRRATSDKDAPASAWLLRAMAERANADKLGAISSLNRTLQIEPANIAALVERAQIHIDTGNYEQAVADLKTADHFKPGDKEILSRLADAYQRSGRLEEARQIAEAAGLTGPPESSAEGGIKVVGTAEEIAAANSEDPATSRKALQGLLDKNPRNAMLMARLGASYRTDDPARALDFYHRAADIQPNNPDYAAGYGAALVQARRFSDAAIILRRAIASAPQSYTAHANLATALYELKQFADALSEYQWLLKARPDLTVAYYFIATAHDKLGEYKDALISYETFLARADPKTNQLEIEKVNLRLPLLRRQIQLKQGVKRGK